MNVPAPAAPRMLTLRLPLDKDSTQVFELLETPDMSLLAALGQIRSALPPHLQDAFVCHAGACNTCSILIDGKPALACTTFTRDLGADIRIAPGLHAEGWDALRDDRRKPHGT